MGRPCLRLPRYARDDVLLRLPNVVKSPGKAKPSDLIYRNIHFAENHPSGRFFTVFRMTRANILVLLFIKVRREPT